MTRFTQAQIAEPSKFIDKLEKRVQVLEQIEKKKRKTDFAKMKQQVKQRDLQLRVRKQNLSHQRALEKMRSQIVEENRKKAQTMRLQGKE